MAAATSSTLPSTTDPGTIDPGTTDRRSADPGATRPPRRRAANRQGSRPSVPLGSLTQGGVAGRGAGSTCSVCDSTSVTHLTMTLTDGTPARFTSCRRCGERRWDGSGEPLSITEVLARASKG